MNIFLDNFKIEFSNLISAIETFSNTNDGHIKGTIIELRLKSIFKNLLPMRFGVARGWIIDNLGGRTEERDILIYDRESAPSFMLDDTTGLFPLESIVDDIQIKSSVRQADVCKIMQKYVHPLPIGKNTLIAFTGNLGKSHVLEYFQKEDPHFLCNPIIKTILIGTHGFYFHDIEIKKLGSILTKKDIRNAFASKYPISNVDSEEFKDWTFIINGIDVDEYLDTDIEIHSWNGANINKKIEEAFRKYFCVFIENIYKNHIGRYLLEESFQMKTFAREVRHQGKTVYSRVDFAEGFITESFEFSVVFNKDGATLNCTLSS